MSGKTPSKQTKMQQAQQKLRNERRRKLWAKSQEVRLHGELHVKFTIFSGEVVLVKGYDSMSQALAVQEVLEEQGMEPSPPSYEMPIAGGGSVLKQHTEQTLNRNDPEELQAWQKYISERNVWHSVLTSKMIDAMLLDGLVVDIPEHHQGNRSLDGVLMAVPEPEIISAETSTPFEELVIRHLSSSYETVDGCLVQDFFGEPLGGFAVYEPDGNLVSLCKMKLPKWMSLAKSKGLGIPNDEVERRLFYNKVWIMRNNVDSQKINQIILELSNMEEMKSNLQAMFPSEVEGDKE